MFPNRLITLIVLLIILIFGFWYSNFSNEHNDKIKNYSFNLDFLKKNYLIITFFIDLLIISISSDKNYISVKEKGMMKYDEGYSPELWFGISFVITSFLLYLLERYIKIDFFWYPFILLKFLFFLFNFFYSYWRYLFLNFSISPNMALILLKLKIFVKLISRINYSQENSLSYLKGYMRLEHPGIIIPEKFHGYLNSGTFKNVGKSFSAKFYNDLKFNSEDSSFSKYKKLLSIVEFLQYYFSKFDFVASTLIQDEESVYITKKISFKDDFFNLLFNSEYDMDSEEFPLEIINILKSPIIHSNPTPDSS